jgi:hypothetical protein
MKNKTIRLAAAVLAALGLLGGYAWSQGSAVLTTLSAAYQIPIITTGALNNTTALSTLKTFMNSGGTAGPGAFTTVTANDIAASDASLSISGIAAAQGGAIPIAGGTSSTSGNAGGAVSLTGGTPGATGIGGASSIAGGIGGSTSGAGGAASVTGGAATASNSAGGAASLIGGAGSGSSAGGAVTITSGAAGATGVAGAVNISVGGATAGNGSAVTVSGGAGAGGTASGGDVNLVPGAAVSTGAPGTVKFNGDANVTCASYYFTGTPAATNQVFFIANRALLVTSISNVFSTAAGGTSTLDVTKDTSTDAPAAGTALGQAAFNLASTANTVQNATLTTTVATKTLAAGNRLSVKFNHAIQSSAGVVVTACMAPV